MYEIFLKLLERNKVTTADVSRATGINQSTFANWKKRRNLLNGKNAKLVAKYFNVSVDYLMTGDCRYVWDEYDSDTNSMPSEQNQPSPALPSGGEGAAKKQRELILTDTEIRLVLAFRNLPGETKLFILNAMGIKGANPETEDATSMAAVS